MTQLPEHIQAALDVAKAGQTPPTGEVSAPAPAPSPTHVSGQQFDAPAPNMPGSHVAPHPAAPSHYAPAPAPQPAYHHPQNYAPAPQYNQPAPASYPPQNYAPAPAGYPLPAVNPMAGAVPAVGGAPVVRGPALGMQSVMQGKPVPIEGFFINTHEAAGMSVKFPEEDPRSATHSGAYFQSFEAELDAAQIVFCLAVKWNVAGSTKYAKSFDGNVDAASGQPWAHTVAMAQSQDPMCRGDYPSADVVFILKEDLVGHNARGQEVLLLEEGEAVKYSFSTTNFANLQKALSKAVNAGLLEYDAENDKAVGVVDIRVEHFTKVFKSTGKPGGMTRLILVDLEGDVEAPEPVAPAAPAARTSRRSAAKK